MGKLYSIITNTSINKDMHCILGKAAKYPSDPFSFGYGPENLWLKGIVLLPVSNLFQSYADILFIRIVTWLLTLIYIYI